MALVVFLRGVNVGGHRTFRPSVLARELGEFGVVNVGAAGTFVVTRPVARAKLHAELRRRLPFDTEIALCDGRDLIRLETENPFEATGSDFEGVGPDIVRPDDAGSVRPGGGRSEIVRFVSVLPRAARGRVALPITYPAEGPWLLRVLAVQGQFVFGVYRRHVKAIGYLGQIDKLFGAPATTRNWNTMLAVVRILRGAGPKAAAAVTAATRRAGGAPCDARDGRSEIPRSAGCAVSSRPPFSILGGRTPSVGSWCTTVAFQRISWPSEYFLHPNRRPELG